MMRMTIDDWRQWLRTCHVLPYAAKRQVPEGTDWEWAAFWNRASPRALLLESGKAGRYTFLGDRPESTVQGTGTKAEIVRYDDSGREALLRLPVAGSPLKVVKAWMAEMKAPPPAACGFPHFAGGAAGYWAYDVARSLERLPAMAERDVDIPDFAFARLREWWVIDHRESSVCCVVWVPMKDSVSPERLAEAFDAARARADEMLETALRSFARAPAEPQDQAARSTRLPASWRNVSVGEMPGMRFSFTRPQFIEAVKRVQAYIRAGDVFQVNLSTRQARPLGAEAEDIYAWLRRINPSPYMACLRCPGFEIVSSSPEQLIRLWEGRLTTRPIAGTRARGTDAAGDEELRADLLLSEKERAEHIMLVDLERNDLGRVAKYGTVRVPELMSVERYSHVMHIVSEVTGELADGKDAYDVLAAVFPGGTITGAPKIRTMEIIEELEPVRRGIYTGAIGWIDYAGNMEFNIVIRTLLMRQGIGYVQSGAGIVADSVPDSEYAESINKAKALWIAAACAEKGLSP